MTRVTVARGNGRVAMLTAALSVVIACVPVDEPQFSLELPSETEIREYAPVQDRAGVIVGLREDLSITPGNGNPEDILLDVTDLAVGPNGSIFAYDSDRFAIDEFDGQGVHVFTFGGTEGQGPGELGRRGQIAVAGGRLVYVESGRIVVWDLETRTLVHSGRLSTGAPIRNAQGNDDGALVVELIGSLPDRKILVTAAVYDLNGVEIARLMSIPDPGWVYFELADGGLSSINSLVSKGEAGLATARRGPVYVVRGDLYQAAAFNLVGTPRWGLWVDWPREAVAADDIAEGRAVAERIAGDLRGHVAEWPVHMPALSTEDVSSEGVFHGRGHAIRVDGQGNLYVFPFVRGNPRLRPVDIYDPSGARILSGMLPNVSWVTARGSHVYGIEHDDWMNERIVRYVLELPDR